MTNSFSDIALVLFTRTSAEEVQVKNFVPQGTISQQLAVAEKLIQQGQQVLAATGLPNFIYSSSAQKGANFGQRLQNVFADLFSQGFEQVIVIGNDCPELKPTDILRAAHQLLQQEVVVGPDSSGGVYLLGLTQKAFNQPALFENIRWNTAWVLTDIATAFNIAAPDLIFLKQYTNINTSRDFVKALQQKLFRSNLLRYFRLLLNQLTTWWQLPHETIISFFIFPGLALRGPPALN
ncbi:MAG: TIGR04282 family arsenosugar biosynthesis glycosyltransferase [Adhaeribacter sp.]